MTELDLIIRLFIALIFGGLIGLERQKKERPAGLRTHMMVCMGAALFTMLSFFGLAELGLAYEPTRIASGIVSGIGFLGAGAIIQSKGHIEGITTASSIWMVAAVGMSLGFGLYLLASSATVLALIVLFLFEKISKK